MKDLALCTPEIFYTPKMQEFIMNRCNDADKQWIYFMIAGKPLGENEKIFETHDEWILCKDVHQGHDIRMLVIFKDMELKTMRDLRQHHVPLLLRIKKNVRRYLRETQPAEADSFKIYFHYTPSVYQLHAHVCVPGQFYNNWRTHNINHVISNLQKDEYYYRDAILIFSMNKGIKTLNIHTSIPFSDSSNEANNLESTPYVKMSKVNLKNTTFKGYKGNNLESLGSNLESSQFVESKKNTKCSNAKTVHTAL